jgi:hypothetical protein
MSLFVDGCCLEMFLLLFIDLARRRIYLLGALIEGKIGVLIKDIISALHFTCWLLDIARCLISLYFGKTQLSTTRSVPDSAI